MQRRKSGLEERLRGLQRELVGWKKCTSECRGKKDGLIERLRGMQTEIIGLEEMHKCMQREKRVRRKVQGYTEGTNRVGRQAQVYAEGTNWLEERHM
jgi:hypothetical protein